MSKAVLVIDIPESCYQCPFCTRECVNEYLDEYEDECMFSDEDITEKCLFERPDWCPLKEVPGKYVDLVPTRDLHSGEYEYGWNACVDEILGE